jgi:hypothetical protein
MGNPQWMNVSLQDPLADTVVQVQARFLHFKSADNSNE